LRTLRARKDIVLRDADKGLGLCVMSREFYVSALRVHLSDAGTYTSVEQPLDKVLEGWVARTRACLVEVLGISDAHANTLLLDADVPAFYVLPKLHKMSSSAPFASRPITAAFRAPTRVLSDILLPLLAPLTAEDGWTLHSSLELVRALERRTEEVRPDDVFLALDVESLYPSMRVDLCVDFTVDRFCEFHHLSRMCSSAYALRHLLQQLLTDNFFCVPGCDSRDGVHEVYTQTSGIAMGVGCCVHLANIYCRRAFLPVFQRLASALPGCILWARGYVDDISACVRLPPSLVTALVGLLNSAVPGLRLTCSTSTSDTQFLDMVIFKGERWRTSEHRLLDLRVFAKPLNLHLYVPPSSAHAAAALSGFISGEGRRFVCLSSSEDLALAQTKSFIDALRARGYPWATIVQQLAGVSYSQRNRYLGLEVSAVATSGARDRRTVAFVLPHSPAARALRLSRTLQSAFGRGDTPHLRAVLAWRNSANLAQRLKLSFPQPNPSV